MEVHKPVTCKSCKICYCKLCEMENNKINELFIHIEPCTACKIEEKCDYCKFRCFCGLKFGNRTKFHKHINKFRKVNLTKKNLDNINIKNIKISLNQECCKRMECLNHYTAAEIQKYRYRMMKNEKDKTKELMRLLASFYTDEKNMWIYFDL